MGSPVEVWSRPDPTGWGTERLPGPPSPIAAPDVGRLTDQVVRAIDAASSPGASGWGGEAVALEKATITNTVTGRRTPVLFNPEEYTINRDVSYAQAAIPGLSAPLLQFVHGNMQTLDMELLLDTYEGHREGGRTLASAGQDVRELTQQIVELMDIDPTTHAPPRVAVHVGAP